MCMLIGKYSSSAHELLLQFLFRVLLGVCRPCHEVLDRRGDQALPRALRLEGPGECSAAQRELEAGGGWVQVRSPSRCPPRRIGDDLEACSPVTGDDSQQLGLRGPLPTADAGADAASAPGTGPGGWCFGGHARTPLSSCGGGPVPV